MADFNSSLPIRTETNGDVVAKIADGTTPSQLLAVDSSGKVHAKLNDGSGNLVTSQANGAQRALDVGVNVAGVQVDPRAIRALTASDVVTANQGAPNTAANGWFVKLTDGTDTALVSASGELNVIVTSALPAGTNNIGKVSIQDSAGNAFSASNPLYVYNVQSPGTEVHDYSTSAALAAGASSNHDYTVAGTPLEFSQVIASASGKMKIEVQVAQDGTTFVSYGVMFNSTANPNMDFNMKAPITVAVAGKVRVIRTNKDNQAQDVYSTIIGVKQ